MTVSDPKYYYKVINLIKDFCFVIIGGENMASRKCDCTTKKTGSRRSSNSEASTDNAKSSSRTTSKKTSRTKNCN